MKESTDSESLPAAQRCCPPHRWVMANGWHRLADVHYCCAHCGVDLGAGQALAAQQLAASAWPTWEDIIAER